MYFIHAELNAILNAASVGTSTEECSMYVLRPPCAMCAGAIINSGIVEVVYSESYGEGELPEELFIDNWRSGIDAAIKMLSEAGVTLRSIQ